MADCMANENSWCLCENFERNCKERLRLSVEEQFEFSIDKSESDKHCSHNVQKNKKDSENEKCK